MTIIEMLGQSVILTVLGMGVVFVFLIIMVIVIGQIGRLVNEKGLDKSLAVQSANSVPVAESQKKISTKTNPEIAAAIMAGIAEYLKSQ